MNLHTALTRDQFRSYIKAAYAKRRTSNGNMEPVHDLVSRFFSHFGVEANVIDTELFVFDGRYMIIAAPLERRDIEGDCDMIYACPGVVWMYLMDITGEQDDGGLADYCTKPLHREFSEGTALYN